MEIIVNSSFQTVLKMKRVLLLMLGFAMLATSQISAKGDKTAAPDENNSEIQWLSIDQVQVKMKEHPKKVYIDMYTSWCGWCKRMDATTFKDADVAKYMNEHYYCVRFDAERKDDVRFAGKMYHFDPQNNVNELALQLMGGREKLSYPTAIYMDEMFQNPQPVPGYHDVAQMEMITKYICEGIYKKQPFPDYQKAFTPTWK